MKIILTAVDTPLADAWQEACDDLDFVSVHRGSIFEVACDAVVSPANSFGFMDGGIDALYTQQFGWGVQTRLQQQIRALHHGELLVGNAAIVDTENPRIPFLIAAPTMRVPMILADTANPYLAARAALLLVREGIFVTGPLEGERISDAVQRIAFPGLGTGVGHIAPEVCARQMRAAIDSVLLGPAEFPRTWAEAQRQHQRLYTDDVRDLQFRE